MNIDTSNTGKIYVLLMEKIYKIYTIILKKQIHKERKIFLLGIILNCIIYIENISYVLLSNIFVIKIGPLHQCQK